MIRKDEGLIALNQSANRDEAVFRDPDTFDITRAPNPHLAFGSGTHECPGMSLSRVEMQVRGLETVWKLFGNRRRFAVAESLLVCGLHAAVLSCDVVVCVGAEPLCGSACCPALSCHAGSYPSRWWHGLGCG